MSLPNPDDRSPCPPLETFLQLYADGELDEGERTEVESHLAGCAPCRAAVSEQRALRARLRAAAAVPNVLNPPAPERLRANVMKGLVHLPEHRPLWRRPSVAWPAVLAASAAGLVLYLRLVPARQTERYVHDAVAVHQRGLPLEVQAPELPHIRSWFDGKVDFAPSRIPAVRQANLLGARLSNVANHPAAYVRYGGPGQRQVSLFVFDAPDLRLPAGRRINDREVVLANQRGYNVALWKDHEIAYSLVSDLGEQDILELVAATAAETR